MPEGFSLELEDYCSHCGDFEPDVSKIEVTKFYEKANSYMTTIKCVNAYKCDKMVENLKKMTLK